MAEYVEQKEVEEIIQTEGLELPEKTRIQEIKENIKAGQAWVKQGNYTQKDQRWSNWKRWKAMLEMRWDDPEVTRVHGQMQFPVNNVFSNYHVVKPDLYFKNPKISCDARKPVFQRGNATPENPEGEIQRDDFGRPVLKSDNYIAARMMEMRINHEIDMIDLSDVVKRCIGANLGPYGIGWVKIGYQNTSVAQFNNERDSGSNYWVEFVDPRSAVFDWMVANPKHMRWDAQEICMPKKEAIELGLKIPENYTSTLPEWLMERSQNSTDGNTSGTLKGSNQEMVVFWEYRDHIQETIDWVLIDAPGDEQFFLRETSVKPFPFKGSCMIPLVLTEDDDDIIGKTDIEPVEKQIIAINKMREAEVHHIENYGTGIIFEDGGLTQKDLKNYEKTDFGWALKLQKGYFNKFKIQGTPTMGSDHYNVSALHKDEMRNTLAISDYQQGGGSVERKATEAQIISSKSSVRIEAKRDTISKFIINIVKKLAKMIQEFDDEYDFIPIVDEDLDDDFSKVLEKEYGYNPKIPFLGMNREMIQGEFNFSFNVEDMIVQPKEVRAAQLSRTLQAVGSNQSFSQKFLEDYDVGKVINEMFKLNGVDLAKFKKGGPAQIPAIIENEMFKNGLEVPEPHEKDDDDQHVLTHLPFQRELESQLKQVAQQIADIQSGMQTAQQAPNFLNSPPEQQQKVMQTAQQKIEALMTQMPQIEMILRNVKIHNQKHTQQHSRKNGDFSGVSQVQPQTGQPAEVARPAQAPVGGTVV